MGQWPMRRSQMGYWLVALEGEGSNCFGLTQLGRTEKAIAKLENEMQEIFIRE